MSFYPCRVGGSNLKSAEEKEFYTIADNTWKTTITLDKNYEFAYIVTSSNVRNADDVYVYVSVNGVKQKGTYNQDRSLQFSTKAVKLRNLKKGDVIVVRGYGYGIFIK